MSVNNIDQIVNTDTFGIWKDRTNLIIEALQDVVSLGDSDLANANGNVVINGYVKTYEGIQTDTVVPVSGAGSTVTFDGGVSVEGNITLSSRTANNFVRQVYSNDGTPTWYVGTNVDHSSFSIQTDTGTHIFTINSATGQIEGTNLAIDEDLIPDLNASKTTAGVFSTGRIPNLSASKIASGTFDPARIPDLEASKITPGSFSGDYTIASGSLTVNNNSGSPILTISDNSLSGSSKVMMVIQGAGNPLEIINSDGDGDYEFISGDTGIRINDQTSGFEILHRNNADTNFDDPISSVGSALQVYTIGGLVTTRINTPTSFNGDVTIDNAHTIRGPGAVPAGAVQGFMRRTAPVGWLVLDGSEIPNGTGTVQSITADFSELYVLLVDIYGANGGNPINLPDMRGYFPRAYDSRSGSLTEDIGVQQEDQFAAHSHEVNGVTTPGTSDAISNDNNNTNRVGSVTTSTVGGDETRPKNIALLYCIKY
jgi:microcystin-dependent protein